MLYYSTKVELSINIKCDILH